ncbi:unnamed protein product [Nippostrongylus brasiliensis]|uniref:Uncharacterized protein n=1 Tax=Nippostrongylus brasiliensis TaxID=27835 RepID=A0A0N4Y2N6_NIPBR|nr:unnamed protein product [Nippostrongylus brasiliensis]
MIRQRGVAGNDLRLSELAKLCRQARKEDLEGRRASSLVEATESSKSMHNVRRCFISYKTKMTAFQRPDGTVTSSKRATENVTHDFYSNFFDSHVHLPEYPTPNDEYVIPVVLPFKICRAIPPMKSRTAPGPDRIRPGHLKNLPPVVNNRPIRPLSEVYKLFTRAILNRID